MHPDPIVEEVRKARELYAARFNYDLEAIFCDLQKKERDSGRPHVSFPPRRVEAASPQAAGTEGVVLPLEPTQAR
jgi:hypothetical protein